MNKETLGLFSLRGKSIVVTGGTGILGKAFIDAIANEGGNIGILGRNKVVAEERAHVVVTNGGSAIPLIADVSKEDELMAAKDTMIKKYRALHGLVNAAGGNITEAVVKPDEDFLFNICQRYCLHYFFITQFHPQMPPSIFLAP